MLPEVTASEVGTWTSGAFQPTPDIPLAPGQDFGWRLYLGCRSRWVAYQEHMILPAPGDWPADPDFEISLDGREVTIHGRAECVEGWIEKRWNLASGDPPGVWTFRITPDGFATKSLHVTFVVP